MGMKMTPKDVTALVRERLNTYEELAVNGLDCGEPLWHKGRLSLVSDLRDYLSQIDQSLEVDNLVLLPPSRPTCRDRFHTILGRISTQKDGFNPFRNRDRADELVCWRQCIWRYLFREGYKVTDIAKATGYNHSTVHAGVKIADGAIEVGDVKTVTIWNEMIETLK